MNNVFQQKGFEWNQERMNMIWHDYPSRHFVPSAIEVQQRVFYNPRDFWLLHPS